jgi:hypothetical protein
LDAKAFDNFKNALSRVAHVLVGLVMVALLGVIAYWVLFGASPKTHLVRLLPRVEAPWVCFEGEGRDLAGAAPALKLASPLGESVPMAADRLERFAVLRSLSPGGEIWMACRLTQGEAELRSRQIPQGLLAQGYSATPSEDGRFAVSAPNGDPVGVMAFVDGVLLFSSTPEGLSSMEALAGGKGEPLMGRWDLEPSWTGHLALADGGRLNPLLGGAKGEGAVLTCAFRRLDTRGDDPFEPAGEARWRLEGVEIPLLKSLERVDWSDLKFRLAGPVALAGGLKVAQGRYGDVPFIGAIEGWLDSLGLSQPSKEAILSSPVAFSVGGRTEILWVSMPGVMLSFPSSGKAGEELAKLVWEKVFLGMVPQPMAGYQSGGYTRLPFSMVAASNGNEAELGAVSPTSLADAPSQLPKTALEPNRGWIYANLPAMGEAVGDLVSVLSMFGGDDNPFGEVAQGNVREALSAMSPLLITFEDSNSGRVQWYNPSKR